MIAWMGQRAQEGDSPIAEGDSPIDSEKKNKKNTHEGGSRAYKNTGMTGRTGSTGVLQTRACLLNLHVVTSNPPQPPTYTFTPHPTQHYTNTYLQIERF